MAPQKVDPYAEFQQLLAAPAADPYAEFNKPAGGPTPPVDMSNVAGAQGPLPAPAAHPAVNMQPSLLGRDPDPSPLANFAKGVVKSIPGTMAGVTRLVPGASDATQPLEQAAQANGTAQAIGKGVGNAAQFLIPGAGEEKLGLYGASKLPEAFAPLAKMGASALTTGAVNKAQGGSFGAGAVTGALGSGATQALKAWAPSVAESALNVLAPQRMNGKTPGAGILEDTTGIKPLSVMKSAQGAIDKYTGDLHNVVGQAQGTPFSMAPARLTLQDAMDNIGVSQNSPTAMRDLIQASDQLHYKLDPRPFSTDFGKLNYSDPIPAQVTPMQGLQYKRGLDHLVDNWAKGGGSPAEGPIKQTYGALANELERTAPGSDAISQKISSLMPVVDRAKMKAASAPTTQQMFNKLAAPTGALVAPVAGGIYGHEHGGAGGAVAGAAAGALLPAMLATPTGQMALARGLYSHTLPSTIEPLIKGAGLTVGRGLFGNAKPENK